MPASAELMAKIKARYPWMTRGLLQSYEQSWNEVDDSQLALSAVRSAPEYRQIFAGNYDSESGDVRMSESDYMATKAHFDSTLLSVGVNPDYFEDEWQTALEGEVSPNEMVSRVEAAYERIVDAAPSIKKFYAEKFGIDMTDSAIIASVLSPRVGDQILSRQIGMAEVGGEASVRGFNIGKDMAQELYRAGVGREEAAGLFGSAREQLPVLNVLAARNDDPDDDFSLEDFTAASIYDDPEQRRRMRRLLAQEQSRFTDSTASFTRSRTTGGVAGLSQT